MALIPFESLQQMDLFRREMDRFFGNDHADLFRHIGPRIDVYETEHEVVVSCEIPGLENRDDLIINVQDNVLTINGIINRIDIHNKHIHQSERFYGRFQRSVTLPSPIRTDTIKASYRNGILEIRAEKNGSPGSRVNVEFQ
jgi:HSP20 family protein